MINERGASRGLLGFTSADRSIKVVRSDEGRIERYRVILPRRDTAGWHMAEVEGPEDRIELVSLELCGSLGIHLSVVTLAPGYEDRPHWHAQGEKVMYITTGRGAILAGEALERLDVAAGDAVYVPPFAIHAPLNDGDEPLTFVMATNAPLDVTVPGGPPPGGE